MKKIIRIAGRLIVALAIAFATPLYFGGAAYAQTKVVTIRFGIQPNILPESIMRVQHGLQKASAGKYRVDWIPVTSAAPAIEALAAGSLDMTDSGALPLLQARARGLKYWQVADAVGDVVGLVVRKGSGIRTLADLKGKTIAYPGAGTWQEGVLELALQGTGVSLSELHLYRASFPDMPVLLEKKAVDGFCGAQPFLAMVMSNGDARMLFQPSSRLKLKEGTLVSGAVAVRTDFAKEHPGAVRAFLKVYNKTSRYIRKDPEGAGRIFAKIFPGVVTEKVFMYAINHGLVYLDNVKPTYSEWIKFTRFTNKVGLTHIANPVAFVKAYVHPEYVK